MKGLKYDRMKLRHALFSIDSKYKKEYGDDESDIDDDFVEEWETQLEEKEVDKARKKFEKDNEKLVEDGKEAAANSVLEKRLKAIKDEFAALAKERGTGKSKTTKSPEKIEDAIEKVTEKIKTAKQTIVDKDEGKEVALGTRWVFHSYRWIDNG